MSHAQVDETPHGTILTYGSVELHLCPLYAPGDLLRVSTLLRIEVVNRVEHADGIVILSTVPRPDHPRPAVTGVLFTHYIRHAALNHIDLVSTRRELTHPREALRQLTERAFLFDLTQRSVTASLAFVPQVRYL